MGGAGEVAAGLLGCALAGCGSHTAEQSEAGTDSGYDAEFFLVDAPPSPFVPYECDAGTGTTISGRVYDPANLNPVYGAVVYVPAMTPPRLPDGPACSCESLYPMAYGYATPAAAVTDANGNFKIKGAPDGASVPLVVQLRKWRRQFTFKVTPCVDNPLPDHILRLPKNGYEGDLPHIAVSTGGGDTLECLLRRIGIDASEFVAGEGSTFAGIGPRHIHVFSGQGGAGLSGGVSYDPSQWLWDKPSDLAPYDLVLLACEGAPTASLTPAMQQVLLDYLDNGGAVFASHFQYPWFTSGPFATLSQPLATWTPGANFDNDPIGGTFTKLTVIGRPFPEAIAFAQWLSNLGALMDGGSLPIHYGTYNAQLATTNMASQPWITADSTSKAPGSAQYFSVNLPIDNDGGCMGRLVYSDLHATGGPGNANDPDTDYPSATDAGADAALPIAPDGCSDHPLTPQETALEFMIFNLTSCYGLPGETQLLPPPEP